MILNYVRNDDQKDYLRELKAREVRTKDYEDYNTRHIKLLKQDIESNEKRMREMLEYEQRMQNNLAALSREKDRQEIIRSTLNQLNIIG